MLSPQLQYFVTGISVGSIYALVALGFTLIHRVTGIINFAQGEFVMLGGMVAFFFFRYQGLPLWGACVLSIVVVTAVGLLLERLAIRTARNASIITLIIITIGASIFIRGVVSQAWPWANDYITFPPLTGEQSLSFFGAAVTPQNLWIIGTTIVFMLLLHLLLTRTPLGKALTACAVNRRAAAIVGIDARFMSLLSFGFAAAMGAVAGILIAPKSPIFVEAGVVLGLKGFLAAAMGGLTSMVGALLGGLGLGLLESFGAGNISSAWAEAIALSVFLAILLIRAGALARESGS